jgi:signal transduction histidine kinase
LRMLAAEPPNAEGARETAKRIVRDGNRASEVITRLRSLFGKKEVRSESINLNDAAEEVITLSRRELQANHVLLKQELSADLPIVTGDRVQLQQVILNLLLNASHAMVDIEDRPRELLIKTQREAEDRVLLAVTDTGVGFDPQNEDKLFEAFYTTKKSGMGIGLHVSRSIIENHHGRIWAVRNEGPGSTFAFAIPRSSA